MSVYTPAARAKARKAYMEKVKKGICTRCGDRAETGYTLCPGCRERQRADCRERYHKVEKAKREARKEAGLCVVCGRKAAEGLTLCAECEEARRQESKMWYDAIGRKRQAERIAAGLCYRCGRPVAAGRKQCAECLEKAKIYYRGKREKDGRKA